MINPAEHDRDIIAAMETPSIDGVKRYWKAANVRSRRAAMETPSIDGVKGSAETDGPTRIYASGFERCRQGDHEGARELGCQGAFRRPDQAIERCPAQQAPLYLS